ncbi:MAG: Hpt domain-containing protein, partial [Thiohalobacteraceae bacterium]
MNGEVSMLDLFRAEIEAQTTRLSEQLLALEGRPGDPALLEGLMRAAHSIKGAGRMVDVAPAVHIAHAMEEIFVAAQQQRLELDGALVDLLLPCVDVLNRIATDADRPDLVRQYAEELEALLAPLGSATTNCTTPPRSSTAAGATGVATPVAREADTAMLDLFRTEVDSQARLLSTGLLDLEQDPTRPECLEATMRAAHSIKGAARMVEVQAGVRIAHVMEDGLVAAQHGKLLLQPVHIDLLLRGVDMLQRIGTAPDIQAWTQT